MNPAMIPDDFGPGLSPSEMSHYYSQGRASAVLGFRINQDNPIARSLSKSRRKQIGTTITYSKVNGVEYRVYITGNENGRGGIFAEPTYNPTCNPDSCSRVCTDEKDVNRGLALLAARLSRQHGIASS